MSVNCKNDYIQIGMSMLILCIFGYLLYIIQYLYLPVGDDVLFQFKNSYQLYTTPGEWRPTELISGISAMNEEIWGRWLNFSGRFTTVYFVPLLNNIGQEKCAIIGCIIYICTGILIGRLCWNSLEQVFLHPIGLLIIYILQYQLSPSSMYMQMWTFICHYHFPILLYLLYYICWKKHMERNYTWTKLVTINLFGVIVGATHELLPLYLFILMTIYTVVHYKWKGISSLANTNMGLVVGYLFVVFAPGNIVRMQIEHDVARTQAGLLEKFGASLLSHVVVIGLRNPMVISLVIVALCWIGRKLMSKQINLKSLLFDNLEYFVAGVASVFMWAIVAPPVGLYTLPFFKAILIIWFLRTVKIEMVNRKWYRILAGMAIIIYLFVNISWVRDFTEVSHLRISQIHEAISKGQDEVVVASYPDTTSNCMTSYNYSNIVGIYDTEEHIEYYGIRIIN